MQFSRPEYWTGWPFPSPRDLPNLGIEPRSPTLQADSLPAESRGKPIILRIDSKRLIVGQVKVLDLVTFFKNLSCSLTFMIFAIYIYSCHAQKLTFLVVIHNLKTSKNIFIADIIKFDLYF